jgi:hypothetical protein
MLPNDPPTFPFRWDSRLPSACGLSPISHLHLASAAFRDATSGRLDHYPRLIREPIAASGIPPAAHHPPEESQRRRWRKPLFNEAMHGYAVAVHHLSHRQNNSAEAARIRSSSSRIFWRRQFKRSRSWLNSASSPVSQHAGMQAAASRSSSKLNSCSNRVIHGSNESNPVIRS